MALRDSFPKHLRQVMDISPIEMKYHYYYYHYSNTPIRHFESQIALNSCEGFMAGLSYIKIKLNIILVSPNNAAVSQNVNRELANATSALFILIQALPVSIRRSSFPNDRVWSILSHLGSVQLEETGEIQANAQATCGISHLCTLNRIITTLSMTKSA